MQATTWQHLIRAAGGQFGDARVARHFGNPRDEYSALVQGCGVVDVSHRTRLEPHGNDRARFLHNMCTNDIVGLTPGQGCEAFFTDAKGHVVGFATIFCDPERLLVETVPGDGPRLMAHLDRYIIREQVTLADLTDDTAALLIAGPNAQRLLTQLGCQPPLVPNSSQPLTVAQSLVSLSTAPAPTDNAKPADGVYLCRVEWTHPGGWLLHGPRQLLAKWWTRLLAAGARPAGIEALDVARVEAGTPEYGRDISDRNLPQEVNRDALAISFNKGCYIGQETVARLDALGHVNKLLVSVRFAGGPPAPGVGDDLSKDGQKVGEITSSVHSFALQAPLALAYLRRGSHTPGTAVTAGPIAGEVIVPGAAVEGGATSNG